MDINWFPGHMARSMRDIEGNLGSSDCVLYVLDCRAVRSCFNPTFDRMITVPTVYVLNKADTVPENVVSGWIDKLNGSNTIAVAVDGTSCSCRKTLLTAIKRACAATLERQRNRGLNSHLRAMVVGVPNTGKSTIINSLCGATKRDTGDRAGVTTASVWARVDNTLDVLDTPGTLYPKITDNVIGENLAIIGSIRDEIVDKTELAVVLISRLNEIDESILAARYGCSVAGAEGLEAIAKKRGFKLRGGECDIDRAAIAVIDDFRKGRLGKIALERV